MAFPHGFGESLNWHLSAGQPDITHQNVQAQAFPLTNPLLGIDPQQIIGYVHKAVFKNMFLKEFIMRKNLNTQK